MTSTPVTNSLKSYFMGTQTTASAEKELDSSFSDVFNSQKKDAEMPRSAKETRSFLKTEGSAEKVTVKQVSVKNRKDGEMSTEEAGRYAEKAAEELAAEMVQEAAETLGISEEEVLKFLESMDMSAQDLLTTDGIQVLVLAVSGENDLNSFVTNEALFSQLKQLTQSLDEAVSEIVKATGLQTAEVEAVFEGLAEQTQNAAEGEMHGITGETVPAENQRTTNAVEEAAGLDNESGAENTGDVVNGAQIMLERSKNDGSTNADKETAQGENPFAQPQTLQGISENVAETQEVQSYFDADTEMIMRQITDYMKGSVSDGVSELEMQLHPESLGNLHVKLTAKEGMVTAQFTAQNETVKNVLESQMIQLKETFKEQGVTVENIEVEVQTNDFAHSMGQNGGQQTDSGQNRAERPKVRRINLNDLEGSEEELSEEEQLAASMLKESGNTVDYTA